MPPPLDPASLPHDALALRSLLLQREADHAADLAAARAGLQEQVLRNEQLKLRLARLLRERFGASSEKLRGAIEQLELVLGEPFRRMDGAVAVSATGWSYGDEPGDNPRVRINRCSSVRADFP